MSANDRVIFNEKLREERARQFWKDTVKIQRFHIEDTITIKTKKTRNRDTKIPNSSWIVKDDNLLNYEKETLSMEDNACNISRAKYFLDKVYKDDNYKKWCFTTKSKQMKRGANAKNWRQGDRKFICPSLHKADNIYQSLGKSKWSKSKDEPTARRVKHRPHVKSWPTLKGETQIPPVQCIVHTKFSNSQCKRSSHNSPSCMCTQHQFLLSKK